MDSIVNCNSTVFDGCYVIVVTVSIVNKMKDIISRELCRVEAEYGRIFTITNSNLVIAKVHLTGTAYRILS